MISWRPTFVQWNSECFWQWMRLTSDIYDIYDPKYDTYDPIYDIYDPIYDFRIAYAPSSKFQPPSDKVSCIHLSPAMMIWRVHRDNVLWKLEILPVGHGWAWAMLAPWSDVQYPSMKKSSTLYFAIFLKFKTIKSMLIWWIFELRFQSWEAFINIPCNNSIFLFEKGVVQSPPQFWGENFFRHPKPLKFTKRKLSDLKVLSPSIWKVS